MRVVNFLCNTFSGYRPPLSSQRHAHGLASVFLLPVLLGLTLVSLTWFAPTRDLKTVMPLHHTGIQYGGIMIHKELLGNHDKLSRLLLCRPGGYNMTTLLSNWTIEKCLDEDNRHVHSVTNFMANEPLWASCAGQYNQSKRYIEPDENPKQDIFEPYVASYPTNRTEHALLKVPIHGFDENVFHIMVIRGRPIWTVLDAVTRFAPQAKSQDTGWEVEYQVDPGNRSSGYVERLFRALSSDTDTTKEVNTTVSYELDPIPPPSWNRRRYVCPHGVFRPNTRFSAWLSDTAARVRHQIETSDKGKTALSKIPKEPFVLLSLRSTYSRRLAGAETGTATEIVLALRKRFLPVYIVDLAAASIEEQILLFASATVVVGMHGAGFTNMVWMQPGASAVIEVAANYGWARYLDKEGKCAVIEDENEYYQKGGYSNLARRFGIQHELFDSVYATRPKDRPSNPVGKQVYYVDANALAEATKRVFNDVQSREN